MKYLGNRSLAIGIASVLALYMSGLGISTLTPIPAFATSSNDHHDHNGHDCNNNNDHHDHHDRHDNNHHHN